MGHKDSGKDTILQTVAEQGCKYCCKGKHREAWMEEMIPEL